MKNCDRCGKATRTIVPVMTAAPTPAASMLDGSSVLPRLALYALGYPDLPNGEHPDDNQFEDWCLVCAGRVGEGHGQDP